MAGEKIRWDLQEMTDTIKAVRQSLASVRTARNELARFEQDVKRHWTSPVSAIYQSNIQQELGGLSTTLLDLEALVNLLDTIHTKDFQNCETAINRKLGVRADSFPSGGTGGGRF